MEENYTQEKTTKKTNKKKRKVNKVVIAILIIIVLCVLAVFGVAYYKLSQINTTKIDVEELEVNSELYNDVADKVDEEEFKDIVNIALFGSDSRDVNNSSSGRSDCIMIASINPVKKTIKLISIPRDSYVKVPGYGYTKINHAYAYGYMYERGEAAGEQLAIKTINSNFGLNITEYVTIDFSGLINVINSVGGIEMDITKAEMDVLNDYLRSSCEISGKPYVPMTTYGHVTLNGEQALAHSRNRYVGNDFERAGRQRKVLMALMDKMSSMNSSTIMSLVSDSFLSEVKTNVNVTKYIGLLTDVVSNKGSYLGNIISTQVPSTDYAYDKHVDGVYYLGFDLELAKQDLYSYIYEK